MIKKCKILKIARATTEKLHDFALDWREEEKIKGKVTCVDKANIESHFSGKCLMKKN